MILRSIVLAMALMFVSSAYAAETPTLVAADSTVTLEVKKMTWGGCVKKVKRALSKVEGIKKIVSADKSTRLVKIETDSKFDVAKAIAAIKSGTGWVATKK